MLDFRHLPESVDLQVFYPGTPVETAGAATRQVWNKPRGVKFVFVFALNAGGAGGGGRSGAAASARGGGGGGACSGAARVLLPAKLAPDRLFVGVQHGPAGGAANTAGGTTLEATSLSLHQDSGASWFAVLGGAFAGGGGAGGTGAGGTAGAAPGGWGGNLAQNFSTFLTGLAGAVGGAHTGAVGGSITPTQLCSSGAGGAGVGVSATEFAGGAVNAFGPLVSLAGGLAAGGAGRAGYFLREPCMFFSGGSGGGSSNAGTGGAGGPGGYGCGGGGGGGGVTGGRGGDGGGGLMIIASW